VEGGETLSQIASAYAMDVQALRAANGLPGDRIYPGQCAPPDAGRGEFPPRFPNGGCDRAACPARFAPRNPLRGDSP